MSNKPLLCNQCDKLKRDIENHKQKLNYCLTNNEYDLSKGEILSCSEEIDRLIVEYMRCVKMSNR